MTSHEFCETCGFIYDPTLAHRAAAEITLGTVELVAIIERDGANFTQRPAPDTWSALEYCCHVRDVLLVQRERVLHARRANRPVIDVMGRDERVDHDGYAEQSPVAVARQLRDAASLFTGVLTRFDDETWSRTVIYPYPVPTERDLAWVALHTQHEVRHHLADVRSQITTLAD
jgi:DinB family protein